MYKTFKKQVDRQTQSMCSICDQVFEKILIFASQRIGSCTNCGHLQRIDKPFFDYRLVAMGDNGTDEQRLRSQRKFMLPHLSRQSKVLEIGCAGGHLGEVLRPYCNTYHGIELSSAGSHAAERIDRVFGNPLEDLVKKSDIEPHAYDVVISSHCLEHIDDIDFHLKQIAKVLSYRGSLILEVPNQSGNPIIPFDDNGSHLHFFSVNSLSNLLIKNGFSIIRLESGARLDARYCDNIRLVARRITRRDENWTTFTLSSHKLLYGVDNVVVWGVGILYEELFKHYFDPSKILFFVDNNPKKYNAPGSTIKVYPPEKLMEFPGVTVIINSLGWESHILREIELKFNGIGLSVIPLASLLNHSWAGSSSPITMP